MSLRFGYALSSEEHRPAELSRNAALAEDAGFSFGMISDHYHPWVDAQGQSPFVWAVLGAISRETSSMAIGTGVTCPLIRIHPAIVAQAAATTADLFSGRFFLGIGTGENLNEHILGDHWPPYADRHAMLEEAVGIMRALWSGAQHSHRGTHYVVENARLYTLPNDPIRVMIAAGGPESGELAGRLGDGLVVTSPDRDVIAAYRSGGGEDKPIHGQITVCWARSAEEGARTAYRIWPNAGVSGALSQELPLPEHFEQAAAHVTPESIAEHMPVGPDVEGYMDQVREMVDAGVTDIYFHQIGPDQEGFIKFYRSELLPLLDEVS